MAWFDPIINAVNSWWQSHSAPTPAPQPVRPPVEPPAPPKPAPAPAPAPAAWPLDKITAEIALNEGGYVNDPDDSGGITNHGITMAFAQLHPELFASDGKTVTVEDMKSMKVESAEQAYVDFFYTPAHFDKVPNVSNITMQLLDMAVNMGENDKTGETEAVKVLQHAVSCATIDGEIGPATLAAVNAHLSAFGAAVVNDSIVHARFAFYEEVVKAHPQDAKFLDGWKKRAEKYLS